MSSLRESYEVEFEENVNTGDIRAVIYGPCRTTTPWQQANTSVGEAVLRLISMDDDWQLWRRQSKGGSMKRISGRTTILELHRMGGVFQVML